MDQRWAVTSPDNCNKDKCGFSAWDLTHLPGLSQHTPALHGSSLAAPGRVSSGQGRQLPACNGSGREKEPVPAGSCLVSKLQLRVEHPWQLEFS